jgi:hypothetical protein
MLRPSQAPPVWIDDLAGLFENAGEVADRLRELVGERRTWRGELLLHSAVGAGQPLLVRADPVFSSPGRVLGFVFIFTDLTERKAAKAARERFQEGIINGHSIARGPLDSRADMMFRNLLSPIVENAQLAALEIADGLDTTHMPALLDGVRSSVTRTAEVLQYLIWHAGSADADEGDS